MIKLCSFFLYSLFAFSWSVVVHPKADVDLLHARQDTVGLHRQFSAVYDLAFQYVDKDNQRAFQLIQKAEALSFETTDSLLIVKCKRVKGQLLFLLERMKEAECELLKVLMIARRNGFLHEQSYIESTLSKIAVFNGEYDEALKFEYGVLIRSSNLSDTTQVSISLSGIAFAYYKLKDYGKALEFYEKALDLAFRVRPHETFIIMSNISLCYANLNDVYHARLYIKKSLEHCGPPCPDKLMINIEYASGLIAFNEREFADAEEHFLRSYLLAREVNDTRFQLDNLYMLADIKINQKRFREGEGFLLRAEGLIDENSPFTLEMIKVFSSFFRLYTELGDFKKASHYQHRYISLKDSIYNEELTTRLMRAEVDFNERENRIKIENRDEVIALKEEVIGKQLVLNFVLVLLAVLCVGCLILLLRNNRHKRHLNLLLEEKIDERTRDLQLSQDRLLKSFHEHDLLLKRMTRGMNETLNTIKGLCATGRLEISDPIARSYFDQIDRELRRLGKLSK